MIHYFHRLLPDNPHQKGGAIILYEILGVSLNGLKLTSGKVEQAWVNWNLYCEGGERIVSILLVRFLKIFTI